MADTLVHETKVRHPYWDEDDPFRYGWRSVTKIGPDGQETFEDVPLTEEDLLFPQEEDHFVQTELHLLDVAYLALALRAVYKNRHDVAVLADHRIDWGIKGIRPMGPDITMLFDVFRRLRKATFHVAKEGGRPVCVIECTSPSTRRVDLERKPKLFYRVGVERLVIVDRGPYGEQPAKLSAFQRGPKDWLPLPLDANGRVAIAPGEVLLGIEDNRVWLYDPRTLERIFEGPEVQKKLEAQLRREAKARKNAEANAQQEAKARADAEAKARDAEAKAREAIQARTGLERQIKELQRQLDQKGKKV